MNEGEQSADVISLDDRRPPVSYTVRLRQYWDGRLTVWVQDVADTTVDRLRVADALELAAKMIRENAGGIDQS